MGGDHKCPLCEATFTRPQHVGRHLRAHTGDRPYECKECPLRFARSDLLSRHVNKAHKHADEGDPGPKKGRRKSMPTLAVKQQPGEGSDAARARKASFNQGQQPHLQAQSMYPHHPLLAGAPGQGWTSNGTAGLNGMTPPHFSNVFSSTALPGAAGNPMYANGFPPQFAVPQMGGTGSNQVMGSSSMGRGPSLGSLSSMGYEFGFKKRACDQCNHSKVRCDFSDPCLRCAQRNIPCTYNKPQKSRSNANISNQRISQAMSVSGSRTPTSLSGSSLSPQSHFSSPSQSVNSPITAMASPNIPYPQRPSSMVALPRQHVGLDSGQSMPYPAVNNAAWSNSFASGLAEPSLTAGQWQQPPTGRPPANPSFDPALPLLHSSPLAGTSSSVYEYSSPTQIPTQIPLPQSYNPLSMRQRGSNLSSASPQQNLAPTPSLSSHGTSPSSTDEPAERRTSQFSISSGVWQDRTNGKPIDPNRSFVSDLNHAMPITYSPAQMHNTLALNAACQSDPSANSTFAWPGSGVPLDPSLQFRQSFASDDEEATRPPSSAASVYGDFGESTFRAIQHRRRSSASLWATAFNQMTLQDGSKVPMAPSMMNPFDPYTAGQVSQQIHQKRPGFPMFTAPEGTSSKVPSLADVKDLWKLFMSEPMPGQTPGAFGEKNNEFESISPELMPQPELGHRTLSKSNSMPDLTSPSMYGPAFFSTYRNGTTPRPGEPQQSYMPTHQPEDHAHQAADDPILRKWKNEIQQRQATFNMMPGGKMGKSPQTDTMLPPNYLHLSDRPMASVLQHASALQQTLAPERTPSFGQQDQSSSSLHPHSFAKTPSKLSSAMARPGNKRLASQTLGPDQQKKGSFDLWNEADDGPLADAEDEGGLQNQPEWKTAGGEASFPAGSGMPPGGGYSNANMGPQQIVPGPQHTNRMFFSTWPPVGASQAMRMGMAGMNELRRGG